MLTAVKQCNNCFSSSLRDKLRDSCSQKIARIAFCWQCIQLIFSWQWCNTHTHTHTHPFNGPFSGITQVSWYQKGKTNLDFSEARDSEWQWHQLGNMQVCISFQTGNHASTSALSFFTGWMPWQWCNKNEKKLTSTNSGYLLVCAALIKITAHIYRQVSKDWWSERYRREHQERCPSAVVLLQ